MVVARKRRKQTNQRTLETSGAREVKPREVVVVADMLVEGSGRGEDEDNRQARGHHPSE
jgi:hypothetical protein